MRAARPRLLAAALALALGWSQGARAEGYRESLAGEAAAAGRTKTVDNSAYNLLLGPIRLKLSSDLSFEYNDNVFAGGLGVEKQSDLFIRPRVNVAASWQVTPLNRLSLILGLGYEFSVNNTRGRSGGSPFTISPDSKLNFDIFIGDFRISFDDSFSLQNNPSTQSAAASTVGFSQFSNDFGITVLWDLNDVILSATLDERTEIFNGTTAQPSGSTDLTDGNRNTHSLRLFSSFLLDETTTWGLQGSAQLSTYDSGSREQTLFSIGPYVQFQLSPYTRFLLAGGGQYSKNTGGPSFQSSASLSRGFSASASASSGSGQQRGDDGDTIGYYWSVSIINRLNASFSHTLSAGHERVFGLAADYQDISYVRYEATWQLFRQASLSGSVGYEDVSQLAGPLQESYRRWTFGVAVGYHLTERLNAALRYTFYTQDSDEAVRVYDQSVTTLTLSYDF